MHTTTQKREGTEAHPLLVYLIIRADNIRPYIERYLILREGTEALPYNECYFITGRRGVRVSNGHLCVTKAPTKPTDKTTPTYIFALLNYLKVTL